MLAKITQQPVLKILATQEEAATLVHQLRMRMIEMEKTGEATGDRGTSPRDDYARLQNMLPSLEALVNDERLYKTV
jgi:hypothetical protein